ncbi:transcriptional repressor AgaR [Thermophagus sp. OGC60D27]|uniref:transcriptional repressor AgaR n=1 Tax=Thermophagus sp. OGC60D27 TaxID=3458415 RepID=UPI004037C678
MITENLTPERRNYILKQISDTGSIKVKEVSSKFNVSEVTVRKDLEVLEKKNLLLRVRGGAIKLNYTPAEEDSPITEKQQKNYREKQLIGKAAVSLIKENDTIILDSGTTTLEIAKNLQKFNKLSIITNALNIAMVLNEYKRFQVIIPGGYLREKSASLVGPIAESFLKNFYCDKLFLGIDSFNLERGVSTPNLEEASMNQMMISIAKEVIAVFDSSKFNRGSFAFIAPVNKINTVITDAGVDPHTKEELERLGVKVIIA